MLTEQDAGRVPRGAHQYVASFFDADAGVVLDGWRCFEQVIGRKEPLPK